MVFPFVSSECLDLLVTVILVPQSVFLIISIKSAFSVGLGVSMIGQKYPCELSVHWYHTDILYEF